VASDEGQRREVLPLEQAAIESDLRRALAGIELSEPDAAVRIWHGFLEHADRPVAFVGPPHPDNDVLAFEVDRPHNAQDHVIARFQRRLGVESADLEYLGTIIAACYLLVVAGSPWERIPDPITIWVHGTLMGEPRGLDSFRRQVESSEAFAALTASRVSELVASASHP
jgi:hypothetical protein